MSEPETCIQTLREGGTCPRPAAYRYTWPGHDEAGVCEEHSGKLRDVAEAMGLHLQLIPTEK